MILNQNGLPYSVIGEYKLFNDKLPERNLFNEWDAESIRIGGSPIQYYEVFIDTNNIDPLYLESRGKLFSQTPIDLYCFYEPIPSQNMQTAFGIDSPDEIVFDMNYKDILERIGHPPKIGSRIHTPHRKEDWVIIQRNIGETMLWSQIRIQILCQRFQENITTGEGKVTQKKPDFDFNQ